jgi:hypothetical protein
MSDSLLPYNKPTVKQWLNTPELHELVLPNQFFGNSIKRQRVKHIRKAISKQLGAKPEFTPSIQTKFLLNSNYPKSILGLRLYNNFQYPAHVPSNSYTRQKTAMILDSRHNMLLLTSGMKQVKSQRSLLFRYCAEWPI